MRRAIREKAPEAVRLFLDLAKTAIKPYADAGKMQMHKDGTTFAPAITAVAAPGHTVDHTMVRISSAGNEPAARPPETLLPRCITLG
jgi:glyoxylase-like metal-dependent hydrolase (beta-lactamase superfamily II)